jgi:hypothetical protein
LCPALNNEHINIKCTKRAQILLLFEKEEIHNFQPLLQVQEDVMQLTTDFLERNRGKTKVVRGSLNPGLLSGLSNIGTDERQKTIYAINAAQREIKKYTDQSVIIDKGGVRITIVNDCNLLLLHAFLHETNKIVVKVSNHPSSEPSSSLSMSLSSSPSSKPLSDPSSTPFTVQLRQPSGEPSSSSSPRHRPAASIHL